MVRRNLIEQLQSYRIRWPEEAEMVDRFLDFVQREPACFERSTAEGHVTGSAWLVDPTGTRVLLTHHAKLNAWLQLGGHADGESDVLKVAFTEARVDIHLIPARPTDGEHFHYDVRYALRALHTDHVVSAESHDLAWVDVTNLTTHTTEHSMLRMARKWDLLRELWLP
jgi:hypothetical protein